MFVLLFLVYSQNMPPLPWSIPVDGARKAAYSKILQS